MSARHIIIEGIDGTGKDTQLQMLHTNVQTYGKVPYFLRTPTGGNDPGLPQNEQTQYGEMLRKAWQEISEHGMDPSVAHLMTSPLFLTDMISLDRKVWGSNSESRGELTPYDLEEHEHHAAWLRKENEEIDRTFVIQSRSWASTYAYQFNSPEVQQLALVAAEKLKAPDLWIWLDQPVEVTMNRIKRRAEGAGAGGKVQQSLYEKGDRLLKTQEAFENLFEHNWNDVEYGPVMRVWADRPAEEIHKEIMVHIRAHGIL